MKHGLSMMNASTGHITYNHDRQTLLSLLAGSAIWFLHLNVVYPLTSLACKWNWFPVEIMGMSGLLFVQLALSVIAALLIGITIYLPWRNWRHYQTEKNQIPQQTEKERRPMMAFVTMLVNVFFLIFVVGSFVPIMALHACGYSGGGL
jgi:hypothetical protein